jgi:phosphatidate cytidylyltransferase
VINPSNLKKRLLFALWAAPLGWFLINADFSVIPRAYASGIFHEDTMVMYMGQLFAMILVFIGLSEYLKMLRISFARNGFWLVYLWLCFQFASYFWPAISLKRSLDTYLLILIVAAEAIAWGGGTPRWKRASLLFSGTVFLSVAGFSLLSFYHEPFKQIFPQMFKASMLSHLGIVTVIFSIVMCDSIAYFVGSIWGRHHFSSISPNKTLEGSAAGLIAAILFSTIGWFFFADGKYSLLLGIMMGLLIGIFAQLGGFIVSIIKRYFNVKDASDIFPGHGGVLDRFDSLFFAAPILNLFFVILVKFTG